MHALILTALIAVSIESAVNTKVSGHVKKGSIDGKIRFGQCFFTVAGHRQQKPFTSSSNISRQNGHPVRKVVDRRGEGVRGAVCHATWAGSA